MTDSELNHESKQVFKATLSDIKKKGFSSVAHKPEFETTVRAQQHRFLYWNILWSSKQGVIQLDVTYDAEAELFQQTKMPVNEILCSKP